MWREIEHEGKEGARPVTDLGTLIAKLTAAADRGADPALREAALRDLAGLRRLAAEADPGMPGLYDCDDALLSDPAFSPVASLQTLDELLERDEQRARDGFPKKVILGRIASPRGRKSVIVPTVVEEKFYHDNRPKMPGQGGEEGGSGEGEEGEVIGEAPVKESPDGQGQGPGGQDGGESHDLDDSRAYDIGKAITEKFNLPNIREKGKKCSLYRVTYELTDINRRFGQILEKKRSLKNILRTNLLLGTLDPDTLDPSRVVVAPTDLVYRIVSPEKEYESQALVFFVRDYSGSMYGETTEVVLSQHVLLYSWLLYQYQERVEKRFVLHDTEAREVPDFVSYYRLNNGGGTNVASAYKLINRIIEKENLAADYNLYVFQGTDGDDWDSEGREALPELEKLLSVVNRMGITIVHNRPGGRGNSSVERYLDRSGLLKKFPDLLRLSTLTSDTRDQDALIASLKALVD